LRAIGAPGPVALADALTAAYPAPIAERSRTAPGLNEMRVYMVQAGLQPGSTVPAPWARIPLASAALKSAGFEFVPRAAQCTMSKRTDEEGGGVVITVVIPNHKDYRSDVKL